MGDRQNQQDEQVPDIELSKIKSFGRWWIGFIVTISRPHEYSTPSIKDLQLAFKIFLSSFTIASIVIYYLGFVNFLGAFDRKSTVEIFLISACILGCGVYILLLCMSYVFKKRSHKFGLFVSVVVQVLHIYAFLIPLLALLLVLNINLALSILNKNSILNDKLFINLLIIPIAILWIYVFWYGVIRYMADFFSDNVKSKIAANLISVIALFAILFFGNRIDLSSTAKNVFNTDKATELLVSGLVERGRITQDIGNEVIKNYQEGKKEYGL